MISGIIIVAVVILFFLIGIKRGIAITILNIAGIVLTAVAAYYLSDWLSEWVYNTFLSRTVTENIQNMITNNGEQYAIENYLNTLPDGISAVIAFVCGILKLGTDGKSGFLNVTSSDVTHTIESAAKSAATSVLAIIFYIISAILIFIIVKLFIKKLRVVFKLPVIKEINMFFGGLLGLVEGIVFVFFAVNILYAFMHQSNPEFFTNSLISGQIFKLFCLFI